MSKAREVTVPMIRDTLNGMITDAMVDSENAVKLGDRKRAKKHVADLTELRKILLAE